MNQKTKEDARKAKQSKFNKPNNVKPNDPNSNQIPPFGADIRANQGASKFNPHQAQTPQKPDGPPFGNKTYAFNQDNNGQPSQTDNKNSKNNTTSNGSVILKSGLKFQPKQKTSIIITK